MIQQILAFIQHNKDNTAIIAEISKKYKCIDNNHVNLLEKNSADINIKQAKNDSHFWSICLIDIKDSDCEKININNSYNILQEQNYNSVNLRLIKVD